MNAAQASTSAAVAAAWWDADRGPPTAVMLDRQQRATAPFSARALAHALQQLQEQTSVELSARPWVHGVIDEPHEDRRVLDVLRPVLQPRLGPVLIHAGPAVGAMAILEALGHLSVHEAVLVTYAQDATPPHHEALAIAMLLVRASTPSLPLMLHSPVLQRTLSHPELCDPTEHPLMPMVRLARAINVAQPTIETVRCDGADHHGGWKIEVRRPD